VVTTGGIYQRAIISRHLRSSGILAKMDYLPALRENVSVSFSSIRQSQLLDLWRWER